MLPQLRNARSAFSYAVKESVKGPLGFGKTELIKDYGENSEIRVETTVQRDRRSESRLLLLFQEV